jgi:hypothetical protein
VHNSSHGEPLRATSVAGPRSLEPDKWKIYPVSMGNAGSVSPWSMDGRENEIGV